MQQTPFILFKERIDVEKKRIQRQQKTATEFFLIASRQGFSMYPNHAPCIMLRSFFIGLNTNDESTN